MSIKPYTIILLILSLFGCTTKDGEMRPQNDVFRIEKNGMLIEANKHTIYLPAAGGVISCVLVYGGNESSQAQFINTQSYDSVTQDGISCRLLNDCDYVSYKNGIKQTMEIISCPNHDMKTKRVSVYLISIEGEAEIFLLQPPMK